MTECPLEHQACFPSLEEKSVREYVSPHVSLSARGEAILDHLLALLSTFLDSQPTSSRVFPFPPSLLFSICDVLQHGRADGTDTSVLPSVLSKLREWRLLDPDYRHSHAGVYKLALDLAEITDEASASTSSNSNRTSHARLRMRWIGSDSSSESQGRLAAAPSPSPSQSAVPVSSQDCAHALPGLNERRSDAGYESCQVGRLGTPDSEDASTLVSRRHPSISGFRSGCSACRHPRVSGPSTPPSPRQMSVPSWEQRTPFSDVSQFDTHLNTTVASPRYPEPSVLHTATKKTKRGKHPSLRASHADENEPCLAASIGVQRGIGVSFPRQRAHYPRISNTLLSRESSSPAAASVQRRAEPSRLPNRTREGDKHTSSHRVASVDLRLPITHRSPNRASPIDLHPHPPMRAQSLSFTQVRSHSGLGSVVARVQTHAVESRSSKRLPSWSHHPPTTTSVTPSSPVSTPPAKASVDVENPYPFARARPSSGLIPSPRAPSAMSHRDRRSIPSQTHKHTQSAGPIPSPPFFYARQW